MDKGDMDRLWTLLSTVWSRAPQIGDQKLRQAWTLALEPFSYSQIRSAAAEYIRNNKFFPDICDITGLIRPEKTEPEVIVDSYKALERQAEAIRSEYHRMGVPSPGEALRDGIGYSQWMMKWGGKEHVG